MGVQAWQIGFGICIRINISQTIACHSKMWVLHGFTKKNNVLYGVAWFYISYSKSWYHISIRCSMILNEYLIYDLHFLTMIYHISKRVQISLRYINMSYIIRSYNVMYHPLYLNVLFLTQITSLLVLDIPLLQLLSEGIEAIKHTGHTHLQKPSFFDGFSGG